MNPEQLSNWCDEQADKTNLPQCKQQLSDYPVEENIQLIIDHELLQTYLHPSAKGRVPLVISSNLIKVDLNLNKFGKTVRIVSDEEAAGAFIRFTVFDCKQDNYCNIVFQYDVEGVTG